MRTIIADSSSLILLYRCGAAEIFLENCMCIVPQSVQEELSAPGYTGASFFSTCFSSGRVPVAEAPGPLSVSGKMGLGESDVISLYIAGAGEYVIIDDGKGAAYCRKAGIPYINALLAVKLLLFKQVIMQGESQRMTGWLTGNGRYSKTVIDWADAADAEILSKFLL